jgi:hypothetical protein
MTKVVRGRNDKVVHGRTILIQNLGDLGVLGGKWFS